VTLSEGLNYRTKTDLVTAHLRRAIQTGRYRPGERLVVDRVATELGVSKVPVREAVTRLTGEGLLESRPNIGPAVPAFTPADVRETALLRVAVERTALELAIPLHDRDSLDRARAHLERMTDTGADFPELNVRFHAALIAPVPYPYMRQTVEGLLRRAQRFATVHRVPGYQADAHEEHLAIFDAVAVGDATTAVALNEEHVRGAADQLVARLEQPPREAGPG
jgi:DNA-binding GntR family transcriptional regulator